jgi:hypothetical protein
MVIHEFLPAIVGQAMADSVYKEVLVGVPIINIRYYRPTNPLGRPFMPPIAPARGQFTMADLLKYAGVWS